MMYKLINGKQSKELKFAKGNNNWLVSQWYYYNDKLVQQAYNSETGEIKIFDIMGNEIN